jgi:hypothetical protein
MYEATAYEITLRDKDGKRWLIAYSERHTQRCVCQNFSAHHPKIQRFIAPTDARWDRARKRYIAAEWEFGFTGRTRRQAKQEGELPRFGDAA